MKIAVWYHCKLSGEGIPSEDFAISILHEQMGALKDSDLMDEANEIHIGINGGDSDALTVCGFLPERSNRIHLHVHGPHARTEIPTMNCIIGWLADHPDWAVLYHHSKGVTRLEQGLGNCDDAKANHRRTMEKTVVWNWRQCVKDLERGFDAVGTNWVDPIVRPFAHFRCFIGTFWWARADYLMTLNRLPTNPDYGMRLIAEQWIGQSSRRPRVLDYERPELSAWCASQIKP